MNILGITIFTHDSSSSLIKGQKLIGCCEEERFTREKHTSKFPIESIKFLLEKANLESKDIDEVVVPYSPLKNYFSKLFFSFFNNKKISTTIKSLYSDLLLYFNLRSRIRNLFKSNNINLSKNCKITFLEHHLSHAASSFFVSGYKNSAIITWDGRGEWPCLLLAKGQDNNIKIIKEQTVPNSLGQFYESITNYLGFDGIGDEYKVMGLSALGEPKYYDIIKDLIYTNSEGKVIINKSKWKYNLYQRNQGKGYEVNFKEFNKRSYEDRIEKKHLDLASSVQKVFNEIAVNISRELKKKVNSNNLCLAGGVAQNIIMNQKIYLESGFKNIFVQPASHDAGLSLGGVLLAASREGIKVSEKYFSPFLGPDFSDNYIKSILDSTAIKYKIVSKTYIEVAKLIANGNVVGWFQGRTEFGPRALGSRSILADPRNPKMKDTVNKKIKFRESFRPFAPSILEDYFEDFFENSPENEFMCFGADVKVNKRKFIPAVTHADNTARPQIVRKLRNPLYYNLINSFYKLTKIPILLNTSFNVQGEPIVNTPTDAIKCFYSSGIDYLVLGKYIIKK